MRRSNLTSKQPPQDLLRRLPQVAQVLDSSHAAAAFASLPRDLAAEAVRATVDELRGRILKEAGGVAASDLTIEAVVRHARRRLDSLARPSLRRAINATGVILHTGLGRAPLSPRAVAAVVENARYCTLEIDPETGERTSRHRHTQELLRALTGAEASLVVNNNAAAVLVSLDTIASGGEVLISRGELVEIGGSFRMPDVIARSRACMVEVGTTNKTRLSDYRRALTDQTRAIVKVHRSNFRIIGFTEEASVPELAGLAREAGIPLLYDLGSGALSDTACFGIAHEPTVREGIEEGADILCFSADKLLGGPQAGIIVGRTDLIDAIAHNPLIRALRVDKLILSALEATLRDHLLAVKARATPTDERLARSLSELRRMAQGLVRSLRAIPGVRAETAASTARAGSGSLPEETIPSVTVFTSVAGMTADRLARALRVAQPAVFARIVEDRVAFDLRTVEPPELKEIAAVVRRIVEEANDRMTNE